METNSGIQSRLLLRTAPSPFFSSGESSLGTGRRASDRAPIAISGSVTTRFDGNSAPGAKRICFDAVEPAGGPGEDRGEPAGGSHEEQGEDQLRKGFIPRAARAPGTAVTPSAIVTATIAVTRGESSTLARVELPGVALTNFAVR